MENNVFINIRNQSYYSSRTCFNKSEHVETNYTLQYKHKGAHTPRAVLREAGRLAGRLGLVNTVILCSPHTKSNNPACSCSQCMDSKCITVFTKPCLSASRKTALSVWAP